MTSLKRLRSELTKLKNNKIPNISANPINDHDLYNWTATIKGPEGTPYENGTFHLAMKFSEDYPYNPPYITFKTKIYHPNIDSGGQICLDILKSAWSPALSISHVLLSISSLIAAPNPDDPLVRTPAHEYKNDRETYDKTAREWTQEHALITT
jgi:ubiquitin-conjugating enzyme E2 D/E